jgi:hypothetical protein
MVVLHFDLLGDGERVINLDAEIADGAFQSCMAKRSRVIMRILLSH